MIYTCPEKKILSPWTAPRGGGLNIPSPDGLAAILSAWGLPCNPAGLDAAPQVLTYHFNLHDVLQRGKVKRLLAPLSAYLRTDVKEASSLQGHFALTFARPERVPVPFQTLLNTPAGAKPYAPIIGLDASNKPVQVDIPTAPHMLIAGATGSGKSVCLNTLLCSLLYNLTPNALRLLMVDTKLIELSAYEGIPHLYAPIAKNKTTALQVIKELARILRERQKMLEDRGLKDIAGTEYPRIFLVIDELADLVLMCKDEINPLLIELAQLGRASGIHLILATQRPTVDVVTGLLKANIPCRLALQCASIRDSMTILDHKGAEQLTGRGDALLKTPDRVHERRLQVALIDRQDVNNICAWWRTQGAKSA